MIAYLWCKDEKANLGILTDVSSPIINQIHMAPSNILKNQKY